MLNKRFRFIRLLYRLVYSFFDLNLAFGVVLGFLLATHQTIAIFDTLDKSAFSMCVKQ